MKRRADRMMLRRYEVPDDHCEQIRDDLPGRVGYVGVTAYDGRQFVDGVLHKNKSGSVWRDLPECFGDFRRVHMRFSRWSEPGGCGGACSSGSRRKRTTSQATLRNGTLRR